jgi:hypothetical protein
LRRAEGRQQPARPHCQPEEPLVPSRNFRPIKLKEG